MRIGSPERRYKQPREEVQVARRELKGARAWLAAQEVNPVEVP